MQLTFCYTFRLQHKEWSIETEGSRKKNPVSYLGIPNKTHEMKPWNLYQCPQLRYKDWNHIHSLEWLFFKVTRPTYFVGVPSYFEASRYSILVQHTCNDPTWLTSECSPRYDKLVWENRRDSRHVMSLVLGCWMITFLDFFAKAQEARELITNRELNQPLSIMRLPVSPHQNYHISVSIR